MRKFGLLTLICSLAIAGILIAQPPQQTPPQQTPPQPSQQAPLGKEDTINVRVTNILAPVKVFDSEGNMITGIKGNEFHLYDNKEEQNIRVDEAYIPISMVIA